MSTVGVEAEVPEARGARAAAIAGIAYVVLFVAGLAVSGTTPDYDEPNREWIAWFEDDGHRARQVIGALLSVAAALGFLVFAVGLWRRLRRRSPAAPLLPTISLGAGLVFVALSIASHIAFASVSAAVTFTDEDFPVPNADVLRTMEQFGIGLGLLGGGWAAAVFVFSASLAARGTTALPPWLGIAGLIVGVVLLLTVFFLPLALLLLWVLAVSIVMLGRPVVGLGTTAAGTG
jgi:Domain of unknown function (DUF4386)